jgi:hypothetical protein
MPGARPAAQDLATTVAIAPNGGDGAGAEGADAVSAARNCRVRAASAARSLRSRATTRAPAIAPRHAEGNAAVDGRFASTTSIGITSQDPAATIVRPRPRPPVPISRKGRRAPTFLPVGARPGRPARTVRSPGRKTERHRRPVVCRERRARMAIGMVGAGGGAVVAAAVAACVRRPARAPGRRACPGPAVGGPKIASPPSRAWNARTTGPRVSPKRLPRPVRPSAWPRPSRRWSARPHPIRRPGAVAVRRATPSRSAAGGGAACAAEVSGRRGRPAPRREALDRPRTICRPGAAPPGVP